MDGIKKHRSSMPTQAENTERIERLAHERIPKLLLHYGVPAVVGTMVNALYSVVDRVFIGQGVSEFAISGLALTFPIIIFMQAFGMLIGVGASSRVSILLGRGDHDGAERILGNAILLTFVTQLLTIVPVMIWLEDVLRLLGANDRTLPFAYDYLKIIIPGNIFSTLCFSYNAIMRSSGYPYKAMVTMLIGAVLNTILDALFIYGFDWGIEGAAWATVISMAVSAAFVLYHFFQQESEVRFRRRNIRFSWEQIWAILSIGMAPFALQLLGSGVSFLINRMLSTYAADSIMADRAIGAYGIINSTALVGFMFMLGIAQGMQPIVGYNYGAGAMVRVRQTFRLCATSNLAIGAFVSVVAMLFPYFISSLFTSSPEMVAASGRAMRLCIYGFAFVGFQVTATQFFQSIGFGGKAMMLSLSRQIFFLIPALFILPPFLGDVGVWSAMPLSDIASGVLGMILMRIQFKLFDRKFTPEGL